jgi:hypothetical protein
MPELAPKLSAELSMKPERVQTPSLLAGLKEGDPSVTWTIETGGFGTSTRVAATLGDVLEGSGLQKAISLNDATVELWISNTTTESETTLRALVPQIVEAAKQCLQIAGVDQEQAAIQSP